MDVKTQKLVELYAKCLANNYNDMSNETQQLKVKVFAMDLGLKYKKIEDLYDEAKTAYEQHQANQERNAILKKKQDEEKALREKMQENATLAFTIESTRSTNTIIDVFRCEDGSVFARERDKSKFPSYRKKENYSNLSISVKSSTISNYQYHPSKTIFTGASSGGIAMGGFHTTEAHYTMNQTKTAKGYIEFGYGESRITIKEVTLAPEIAALYRRNKDFRYNFNSKNTATCHREISDSVFMNAALGTPEFGKQMEMVGHALDAERIPYSDCVQIADILNGIIHNKLPEQDEEIYTKAVKFSQTKDLQHLAEAVNRFEYIKDYKDSEKLLGEIKPIYETLVQESKEREVLRREKTVKKKKLIMATIAIIAVIGVVVTSVIYGSIQKNMSYENAKAHLDSGRYEEAIEAFSKLGNYKDSSNMVLETKYQQALSILTEDGNTSYNLFKELGDYKDSAKHLQKFIKVISSTETKSVELSTDFVKPREQYGMPFEASTYYWKNEQKSIYFIHSYNNFGLPQNTQTNFWNEDYNAHIKYKYENGKLISKEWSLDSSSKKWSYTYTEDGKLKTEEIREYISSNKFNGDLIVCEYDMDGRVTSITKTRKDVVKEKREFSYELTPQNKIKTQTYTEVKLVDGVLKETERITFTFDEFENEIKREIVKDGKTETLTFENEYDAYHNLVLVKISNGHKKEYEYQESADIINYYIGEENVVKQDITIYKYVYVDSM